MTTDVQDAPDTPDVQPEAPDQAQEKAPDHAQVIAMPPLIFLAALLAGVGVKWVVGGALPDAVPLPLPLGIALVWLGLLFELWFAQAMKEAGQDVKPTTSTPSIISTGPFRFSRNPAYVGLVLILLGMGLALNNPWIFLMLIPTLVLMHYGVIRREEAYLERKFGNEYLAYKAQVRRWL